MGKRGDQSLCKELAGMLDAQCTDQTVQISRLILVLANI